MLAREEGGQAELPKRKTPSKSAAATMLTVIIIVFILDGVIYLQHSNRPTVLVFKVINTTSVSTTTTAIQGYTKGALPGYPTISSTIYTTTVVPSGSVQCKCLNESQISSILNVSGPAAANAVFGSLFLSANSEVAALQYLGGNALTVAQQNSLLAGWEISYSSGSGNSAKNFYEHVILTTNPANVTGYLSNYLFPRGVRPISSASGLLSYGYVANTTGGRYSLVLLGYRYGYAVDIAVVAPAGSDLPPTAEIASLANYTLG